MRQNRVLSFMAAIPALILSACTQTTTEARHLPELKTVPKVEISRYLGKWYEIASFPQWFQKDCAATTATYSLRPDGQIDVLNACRKGGLEGPPDQAHGRAYAVDETATKLKVTFFWPFYGDYWVIDLAPDYSYAVVGHPSRDYLWILSRTPTLDQATYGGIVTRLTGQGYDLARLSRTAQNPVGP